MRLVVFSLLSLVPLVSANRTSCFAYVDCFERAQVQLKDCVGGSAVSLTVESKDQTWTAADLVKANGLIFNQCQDRLYREIVDFDTLQLLVQEDSRECFEKLPGSGKRINFNPASCVYSPLPIRDSYGKDTPQCVTEYYDDRQRCEQLLECCPDHLRCAERMNAVSVAYQHAKAKSVQIVNNMLKCVTSADPTTAGTVALIENQRSSVRNSGLPFFRPDVATEERITRRLSLTSLATLEQRRQRFNRRYNQVRALLSQRVHHIATESSRQITPVPTTQIPSERRLAIIRNLLKNADDQELAQYVSLIADGNFEKLSALEREKMNKMDNEEQVDQAMQKMTKIRDAIKAALATKEQKTLNFLETSASTNDKLATVSDNEWNSPDFPLIGKVMSEIDSDTLVRAKKFANALGEALQAQKELLLATKEVEKAKEEKEKEIKKEEEHVEKEEEKKPEPMMIHGSIPTLRTATKADADDDREPHDFNQLTHKLRKVALDDAETTTEAATTAAAEETTESAANVEEETTEGATTVEQETTEAATEATTEVATEAAPAVVKEMPALGRPLSQSKMVSIVQPHNGALETVMATEEAPNAEILEQLEAEVEKKGHKEPKEEEIGEIKGEDKRALVEDIKQEKEEKEEKESQKEASEKDVEVTKEELATTEEPTTTAAEETATTPEEITMTEEETAATEESTATLTTTEETTTAAVEETAATEEAITEEATTTAEVVTTTELPTTSVPLNEKSKKLMKKIMKDMKKKIEKMRKKIKQMKKTTTTTEAPTTTAAPEDRPSLDVEPLTESVEGSGLEVTTVEAETTTEVVSTTTAAAPAGTNFCSSFANCDDMVRDYHEQCDRRFSPDIINHGIEDAEIVSVLKNATISNNEIVLRACLRPLDKASYANLKQLLAIQRGVRRACLELGRHKNVLSEEQLATCNAPLPSTEALDDFLSKTHTRSEETHTLCLAKLAPLRDTCQSVAGCCASINACDNYIASSPVRQLREEAQGVLIKRQHSCEERMLDTLKYIQKRLTTRRRRV